MLTTAYQATANSGEVTRAAARTIAEAIGATHLELDVEEIHQGYLRANLNTALLLATNNRSGAAVGYGFEPEPCISAVSPS